MSSDRCDVAQAISHKARLYNTSGEPGRWPLACGEVRGVLFILAVVFEDIRIRQKLVRDLHTKGLGVHLRVFKANFVIQVSEVAAPEPLQDAECVAVRVAHAIEPGLIIET